jgi:hypothetical protein
MIRSIFLALALVAAACGAPEAPIGDSTAELSANGCHYKCNRCPKDQVCAMSCVASGHCSSCVEMQLCIIGYHFDDKACKCVPDKGTSGPCTSDHDCRGGDLCCYPCGVGGCSNACVAPAAGGGCPLFP